MHYRLQVSSKGQILAMYLVLVLSTANVSSHVVDGYQ